MAGCCFGHEICIINEKFPKLPSRMVRTASASIKSTDKPILHLVYSTIVYYMNCVMQVLPWLQQVSLAAAKRV